MYLQWRTHIFAGEEVGSLNSSKFLVLFFVEQMTHAPRFEDLHLHLLLFGLRLFKTGGKFELEVAVSLLQLGCQF